MHIGLLWVLLSLLSLGPVDDSGAKPGFGDREGLVKVKGGATGVVLAYGSGQDKETEEKPN